jgi:hypothetical protein
MELCRNCKYNQNQHGYYHPEIYHLDQNARCIEMHHAWYGYYVYKPTFNIIYHPYNLRNLFLKLFSLYKVKKKLSWFFAPRII